MTFLTDMSSKSFVNLLFRLEEISDAWSQGESVALHAVLDGERAKRDFPVSRLRALSSRWPTLTKELDNLRSMERIRRHNCSSCLHGATVLFWSRSRSHVDEIVSLCKTSLESSGSFAYSPPYSPMFDLQCLILNLSVIFSLVLRYTESLPLILVRPARKGTRVFC
jgi:hypothetical protein